MTNRRFLRQRTQKLPPSSDGEALERLALYAEQVTAHALTQFLDRCPLPQTAAEIATHLAYADGLIIARAMTLSQIEAEAMSLGLSIYQNLISHPDFERISDGLSPQDFVARLHCDDRQVPKLWLAMPKIAQSIAFWQGLNDVYEFAVCFITHATYPDDYRGIRRAVETSLRHESLLAVWKRSPHIEHRDFSPKKPVPCPMGAGQRLTNPQA